MSYTYDDPDCLRLNVYAPAEAVLSEQELPVLVWIHGGGLAIENGNADLSMSAFDLSAPFSFLCSWLTLCSLSLSR